MTGGAAIIETDRILLRELDDGDADFIVELLNDPDFIRHIGDRQVRTAEDARAYIRNGPVATYTEFGYGLYHVSLKGSGAALGICGLVRRPNYNHPDIGYAFLPAYRGQGYAVEAARATLSYARETLGLKTVLAIIAPANEASMRLARKIGMIETTRAEGDDALVIYSTVEG
jgi:RimJ/RimL family protein N-acetyltransferase